MDHNAFVERFRYFAGSDPYPWQSRLFYELVAGRIPEQLAIPTGLGKTSVMLIWILALAEQGESGNVTLPRRLIYVVNRRTVVDQATATAENIRQKLLADHPVAEKTRAGLARVATLADPPLAISTLRGEFADNGEWKQDPSRPSIVVGTVDMVGSKLLFAGFGDGRKRRSLHAGLVGQDALLVHDEAHLDPAFAELLKQIRRLQQNAFRPLQVMALSATLRNSQGEVFSLSEDDRHHPLARLRLTAEKQLTLHSAEAKSVPERLAEIAASFEGTPVRVLVFVRSPKDAQERVASGLRKLLRSSLQDRLALLTGTMRGYERDLLLRNNPVFQAFLHGTQPSQTLYLIATSAGEVGVDLDADHLVTELAPLDSLLQRLGRVNRKGGQDRRAQVHVVIPKPIDERGPLAQALLATERLLQGWAEAYKPCNLSPENISALLAHTPLAERMAAYSPAPATVPLTDLHLDFLAATSLDELPAGSPDVPSLLHGLQPDEPEVALFWRRELSLFSGATASSLQAWLELCPPLRRELVHLPLSYFSRDFLGKLKKRLTESLSSQPVVVFSAGRCQVSTLGEISQWEPERLAFSLLALDATVGGLDATTGVPAAHLELPVPDVAELDPSGHRVRLRVLQEQSPEGEVEYRTLEGELWEKPAEWELLGSVPIAQDEEGQVVKSLCLFAPRPVAAGEEAEHITGAVTIAQHTQYVTAWARLLAARLNLPPEYREALEKAAFWHDQGKASPLWQHFARGDNAPEPLAKAERYRDPRLLGGFRHEWSSCHRFLTAEKYRHDPALELTLHLVASHHGWGRPHFPANTYDPQVPPSFQEELAIGLANNYATLQHRLGWWTLAWLEAVFRAADALASRYGPPPEPGLA